MCTHTIVVNIQVLCYAVCDCVVFDVYPLIFFSQSRKKSTGVVSLNELLRPVVPLDTSKLTPSDGTGGCLLLYK